MSVIPALQHQDQIQVAAKSDLSTDLNRALEEANAPIRTKGPGIIRIGGLIVKQLFRGDIGDPAAKSPAPLD